MMEFLFSLIHALLTSQAGEYSKNYNKNSANVIEYPDLKWPMSPYDKHLCRGQFKNQYRYKEPDLPVGGKSIDEILTEYGYPGERINVTTEDGYILGVYRIPFSPKSPLIPGEVKKAVILQHGVLANGGIWLIQEGSRNLAMLLADEGFDVFIANARGNKYSKGHIDPEMTQDNVKYWDFSFHEMGVYDNPAIIEMVTKVTTNQKMYYIGYSMGANTFAIMLALRPQYNERILTSFLLAPAIYMGNSYKSFQRFMIGVNYYQYSFMKFLRGELDAHKLIAQAFRQPQEIFCQKEKQACGVCPSLIFLTMGYDAPQMNYTTLSQFLTTYPETGSTKTIAHFMQLVKSGTFCEFNYGFKSVNNARFGVDSPPCYDLGKVTVPLVVYWGENDIVVKPQDVAKTISKFGKSAVKEVNRVDWPLFTHLDFSFAKDADVLVYHGILKIMKNATYDE